MAEPFDIIILGGGIAGCGVAAFLAEKARVLLVEKELHPGMHATGRSAALFSETYGGEPIRALSRASNAFLAKPPEDLALPSPLRPRGCLYIATADQQDKLLAVSGSPLMLAASSVISADDAIKRCPILNRSYLSAALWEPGAQDLDVDALLQAFIRRLRGLGGSLRAGVEVTSIEKKRDVWHVIAGQQSFQAPIIVNAAGAWADGMAVLAGLSPLGIRPLQRTAILVEPPRGVDASNWPCVIDIDEQFYFKPDGAQLLLSPADESPVDPCDAQPDELDVAIAVDRVEQATTLEVRRVSHKWAGLRSFAPDRLPVVGFDPRTDGFFWLAGQGGYGIQTAPALSEAAALLVQRRRIPSRIVDHGVNMDLLKPERLIARSAAKAATRDLTANH